MNSRLAPLIVAMVGITGCGGGPSPTSPTTPGSAVSLAGSWSGSIGDPISGNGTAQLALSAQAPNALTGTWAATFNNGETFSGPAVVNAVTPSGYAVTMYVEPQPTCTTTSGAGGSALLGYTLINVVVTRTQLTAVSGRLSCSGMGFGSMNLSRQ